MIGKKATLTINGNKINYFDFQVDIGIQNLLPKEYPKEIGGQSSHLYGNLDIIQPLINIEVPETETKAVLHFILNPHTPWCCKIRKFFKKIFTGKSK